MEAPTIHALGRLAVAAGIAVALALAVLLVAPGLVGAEATYVVESDSMAPTYEAGDLVVVTDADAGDLSTGTVITYRQPGEPGVVVTHRIVEVVETDAGTRYRTRGDANPAPDDELVAPEHVVGSVALGVPLVGHLVAFAGTDLGLVALVIAPATLLAAGELRDLYRHAATPPESDRGDEP